MFGLDDHGFVDISGMVLNAAISRSILAVPDAYLVMAAMTHGPIGEFAFCCLDRTGNLPTSRS